MRQFLVHDARDNVGVAVVDIEAGCPVVGGILGGGQTPEITVREHIPLGHKIALRDLEQGATVIKYGEDIGKVVVNIRAGEHVHVHNLKTKRW